MWWKQFQDNACLNGRSQRVHGLGEPQDKIQVIVHGYCPRLHFHLHWVPWMLMTQLKNKISCSSDESECIKDMINPILYTKCHGEFKKQEKMGGII